MQHYHILLANYVYCTNLYMYKHNNKCNLIIFTQLPVRHVARRDSGGICPPNCLLAQIYLTNFLTSFATNVPKKCHNSGYKPKHFLLAPLAALFSTPILKNGGTARYCDGYF